MFLIVSRQCRSSEVPLKIVQRLETVMKDVTKDPTHMKDSLAHLHVRYLPFSSSEMHTNRTDRCTLLFTCSGSVLYMHLTVHTGSGPAQKHQLSDAGPGLVFFFLACSPSCIWRGAYSACTYFISSKEGFYTASENGSQVWYTKHVSHISATTANHTSQVTNNLASKA